MKRILILLLTLLMFLTACGKTTDTAQYKTDVTVTALSEKMTAKIDNAKDLTLADEGWVALNIPVDLALCQESTVYINTTGKTDIIGIFKAKTEADAEKLLNQSEAYLDKLEANWMSEYLAEELPKIENAVAKKCGLYVTFLVLDEEPRNNAANEFEAMLKA